MGERLANKVAIVTGAASGMGRSTSILMAQEGAAVVVVDLDGAGAEAVADQIRRDGGDATAMQVDVGDVDAVTAMVVDSIATYGQLDVLHNNAALVGAAASAVDRDLLDMSIEVWDRTMAVNLRGPMVACKAALPHMIERGKGSIINTTSVAATAGNAARMAYGASKGGLATLTIHIATGYGRYGVRCNAIAPGAVQTNAMANLSDDALRMMSRHHLLGRLGRPEEIANAAVFLASDESSFVTGHVLVVDGGFAMHQPQYADAIANAEGARHGKP